MLQSLREYMSSILQLWWMVLISVAAAVVGAGLDVGQTTGIILITVPTWLARALWIGGLLVVLICAPFKAFDVVRRQRDNALESTRSRPSLWIKGVGFL